MGLPISQCWPKLWDARKLVGAEGFGVEDRKSVEG